MTSGRISFTFDDGKLSTYSNVFPIFKDAGLRGNLAVITDSVGSTDQYTWDQLAEMAAAGWEVVSHSRTHEFTFMNEAKMHAELVESRAILQAHGHSARVFNMPGGPWGANPEFAPGSPFIRLVERTYDAFTPESRGPHLMKDPVDRYNIGYMCCECYGVAEWEFPLATVLDAVDEAARAGHWVNLNWHDVKGPYVRKLQDILASALPLIRSGNLVNVTLSEGVGLV